MVINLIETKDVQDIYSIWEKINDRTKIHTTQIKQLQREVKELQKKLE